MAQCTFDPFNVRERADMIRLLKTLDPNAFTETSTNYRGAIQQQSNSYIELTTQLTSSKQKVDELKKEINSLKEEKKEVKSELDRSRSEINKRDQKISQLQTIIDKLNQDLDSEVKKAKIEAEAEAQSLLDDEIKKHQDELRKSNNDYLRLERESYNKVRELEKTIETLKKRLEGYEPIGAEVGEEKLFKIDVFSHSLEETNDTAAPYIVRIVSNDKVVFQFNTDGGPMVAACANRSEMLEPFCEIKDAVEGATAIRRSTWGEAKLSPSGNIRIEDITKKAIISLIRN